MVWVQECLSLAKEYTKQDIVGYYFEVSLAKDIIPKKNIVGYYSVEYTNEDIWVQECLSLAKEYTKQDIVGYYFEVSLAKEYTKEDILQWFEC